MGSLPLSHLKSPARVRTYLKIHPAANWRAAPLTICRLQCNLNGVSPTLSRVCSLWCCPFHLKFPSAPPSLHPAAINPSSKRWPRQHLFQEDSPTPGQPRFKLGPFGCSQTQSREWLLHPPAPVTSLSDSLGAPEVLEPGSVYCSLGSSLAHSGH